ncbi:diguanylate cyclase domain-containing protein [Pantanalinema sp. GBBB05]|uniref:diguanylate cyclase domain-containing protein n=1 Tax=Pantanalinema sp. GBBB05 TaxID=2604139 RepID=UPI001E124EAE|nr:PleD family two-component system response regulator [Pantanalinema sp. GBBB05]
MLENGQETIILVVDDNPTNLLVLSQTLKEVGLKVRVSMDGESALEQVQEDPPELILLDIQMPGIDGFETCERLKINPLTCDIPVIFITANHGTDNIIKGLSLGAVDYIVKPFQKEEVLARVQVHLRLRLLARKVQEQAIALQLANQQLEQLANLDGLTQVANRRRFDEQLEKEWNQLVREQVPLSLILCDIDYFKRYNDFYGHQAGDSCLKQVAKAIEQSLRRPNDFVARYGGEEFVVILPNTHYDGASYIAKSIQARVEQLRISHAHSEVAPYLTLSLGVSTMIPTHDVLATRLIATADKALYEAKRRGRNGFYVEAISV